MARKPNYGFEKRKKELDRKAKKDAKREDRRRREQESPSDVSVPPPADERGEHRDTGSDAPAA